MRYYRVLKSVYIVKSNRSAIPQSKLYQHSFEFVRKFFLTDVPETFIL